MNNKGQNGAVYPENQKVALSHSWRCSHLLHTKKTPKPYVTLTKWKLIVSNTKYWAENVVAEVFFMYAVHDKSCISGDKTRLYGTYLGIYVFKCKTGL